MVTKTLLHSSSNRRTVSNRFRQNLRPLLLCIVIGIAVKPNFQLAHGAEGVRGPDVIIVAGENKTILEFRQNGQLRMIQIIPKRGKPYYLVPVDPSKNGGDLMRAEKLVPSWVIASFD